jgi:hypothetical protein
MKCLSYKLYFKLCIRNWGTYQPKKRIWGTFIINKKKIEELLLWKIKLRYFTNKMAKNVRLLLCTYNHDFECLEYDLFLVKRIYETKKVLLLFFAFTTNLIWFGGQFCYQVVSSPFRSQLWKKTLSPKIKLKPL